MHILYGTDGSTTARGALDQVLASFALPADTEVAVLAVEPEDLGTGIGADAIAEVNIDEAQAQLAAAGLTGSRLAAVGDPATELIARAEATQPDLVVVGADRGGQVGPHPLARSIGRVATQVALDGHASVFVSASPSAIRRVIVACDGSGEAERAIQLFLKLPFRTAPDVFVVSVVDRSDSAYGGGGTTAVISRESTSVAHAIAAEAAQAVRAASARLEIRTPTGSPAEQIAVVAEAVGADLIVIGTRGLSAQQRRRLGSVTGALLERMPTSLLIARSQPEATPG